MNLKRFAVVGLISLASDALLIFGGIQFARLNSPPFSADWSDYMLYSGSCVAAGIALAVIGRGAGFVGKITAAGVAAIPDDHTAQSLDALGLECHALIKAGNLKAADARIKAAATVKGIDRP